MGETSHKPTWPQRLLMGSQAARVLTNWLYAADPRYGGRFSAGCGASGLTRSQGLCCSISVLLSQLIAAFRGIAKRLTMSVYREFSSAESLSLMGFNLPGNWWIHSTHPCVSVSARFEDGEPATDMDRVFFESIMNACIRMGGGAILTDWDLYEDENTCG